MQILCKSMEPFSSYDQIEFGCLTRVEVILTHHHEVRIACLTKFRIFEIFEIFRQFVPFLANYTGLGSAKPCLLLCFPESKVLLRRPCVRGEPCFRFCFQQVMGPDHVVAGSNPAWCTDCIFCGRLQTRLTKRSHEHFRINSSPVCVSLIEGECLNNQDQSVTSVSKRI